MNTANKITIFRIVLVPFFMYFLLNEMYILAFVTFFIASITDHLDGEIARKQEKVTDFGKFADPLADKALVMTAFVCFVQLHQVSAVAIILMFIREFVVMSVRLMAAKKGDVIAANIWGKAKTISQFLTVFMGIALLTAKKFYGEYYPYEHLAVIVKEVFLWGSVVLSWVSGTIYIYENREFVNDR